MTNELNVQTLERVLEQVPQLQGLHIIGCARVDHTAVLKAIKHVTDLESLSFTVMVRHLLFQPPHLQRA